MNEEHEFIKELEALSRKYKLQIGGCGCCGSPYIEPLTEEQLHIDAGYVMDSELNWAYPSHYGWEKHSYKDKVIK